MADNVRSENGTSDTAHDAWPHPSASTAPNPVMRATPNTGVALSDENYGVGSPRRRSHMRSSSVLKDSDDHLESNGDHPKGPAAEKTRRASADPFPKPPPYYPVSRSRSYTTSPSTISHPAGHGTAPNESESSSESTSTLRNSSPPRRDDGARVRNRPKKPPTRKPNAMNFLDVDSPEMNPEVIRQSINAASHSPRDFFHSTSPSNRSASSASSTFRDDASDLVEGHETDRSTSPERSIDGDGLDRSRFSTNARVDTKKATRMAHGSPEMPQARGGQPHMSPDVTTPRAPNQGSFMYPPRPDRPPPTGYELLASRLSTPSGHIRSALKPMYRRFETLNHRLLLHLQDELCELEEQLHRLDSSDTQNRRLQNCILPASRRAEQQSGSELSWVRLDILGKIGFKIEQYNNVLSSFRKTQSFPTPSADDVRDYRDFLMSHGPIVEAETRFLDAAEDLICLSEEEEEEEEDESDDSEDDDAIATPLPRDQPDLRSPKQAPTDVHQAAAAPAPHQTKENSARAAGDSNNTMGFDLRAQSQLLPLAAAATVILPVLAFAVVPGFLARMALVFFLASATGALVQGGYVPVIEGVDLSTHDLGVGVACYGAVLVVLAAAMR